MKCRRARRPDILVEKCGSIFLFRVQSRWAARWVRAHVQLDSWQWLGNGFSVDQRFAADLAHGMINDGLHVQ